MRCCAAAALWEEVQKFWGGEEDRRPYLPPWCLQGHQVDTLIGRSAVEPSNFTYWVPPPPPADAPGGPPSAPNAPPRPIKVLL